MSTTEVQSPRQKYWKKTDDNLLEEWADHGKSFRWMHEQAASNSGKRISNFRSPLLFFPPIL